LITDNEKLVLFAEDINQAKTYIFSCIRGKDGWSIQQNHDYNLETLRIEKAGGDTSKRKILIMYFGTTIGGTQHVDRVSF